MTTVANDWFACDIDRRELKVLLRRGDGIALAWFAGWLACLGATGTLAYLSLGTWWVVPAFLAYGTIYGFAGPIVHECSHGTPFRTRQLNEAVYFVVALMVFKERTYNRWHHARHHTNTIIVGEDPEILLPSPISPWRVLLDLTNLGPSYVLLSTMVRHAYGSLSDQVRAWVPESEHAKLVQGARVNLFVYAAILAWILVTQSWTAFLFLLILPRVYGGALHTLFTWTQHVGLASNVRDHRRTTRDVHMNPVFRFLYWNMNYHLSHHLYPMIPFHALPRLHEQLKDQLPRPYPGVLAVYRELFDTCRRQRRDPSYHVEPLLPDVRAVRVGARAA
jgi:fatty acid desaturase